jgi:hypothetical protein
MEKIEAYRILHAALEIRQGDQMLLEALNTLREQKDCLQCQKHRSNTRKLRRKITEKNKQIKDLENKILLLRDPRQGLIRFRDPDLIETTTDDGPNDLAHAINNSGFGRIIR